MIEELMKVLQDSAKDIVANNSDIPKEHSEGVAKAAQSSIMDTIKSMAGSGNAGDIMKLATDSGHPMLKEIQNNFIQKIMNQFGFKSDMANKLAGSLIPQLLAKLKDSKGFDLSSITSMIGDSAKGADVKGALGGIKKMFGLK